MAARLGDVKLYDYDRSSAAYRVRIALNLKRVEYERLPVNLVEDEHASPGYRSIHPQGLIPALLTGGERHVQSLAILEYLEEVHPEPALLPRGAALRSRERARALMIACDIHPLNNLRVRRYLRGHLCQDEQAIQEWMSCWIRAGFEALESWAGDGPFLGGASPMMSDVCLVPQMYNARRFDVEIDDFPRLVATDQRLRALDAFARAAPGEG